MNSKNILSEEKTIKIKSRVNLENLKSNFIFKKILNCMKKNKSLEIKKYNKKLQKRANLIINDYIEYFQLYSSVELELIPCENQCDKFINILKEGKEYYHIYFDNSNEEIKRNYLEKNEKVKMIKIIIDEQVKSFEKLFNNCNCINSIFFKNFYRNNITNMYWIFS